MTKIGRIRSAAAGLLMILTAVFIIARPDLGILAAIAILSATFYIRGFQSIWYYFSMARFMVGGKSALYRGIIYLDIGIFTASIAVGSNQILILYLAAAHAVAGLIDLLRAVESRRLKSGSWKSQAFFGGTQILIAIVVATAGFALNSVRLVAYIYAAGLIYSALLRIITAFRRTAIVYIQ